MASILTELQAGFRFEPFTFRIDSQRCRAYCEATGDDLALYEEEGVAPPLAVVAIALGVILEAVSLPAGSLHGSESFTCYGPVPLGADVECRATLAQRSQRSGWIASVLQSELYVSGAAVIIARATVLTPQ